VAPKLGAAQGSRIAEALASASSAVDADRSALGEAEVARLVTEHARPLESGALTALPQGDLDELAERAEKLRARAPFAARVPFAPTARERSLRHYLSSFGIESPPRASGERERSESTLAVALEHVAVQRPRPSVVYVWAPAPLDPGGLAKALSALRRRRIDLRWSLPSHDLVNPNGPKSNDFVALLTAEVARMRATATRMKGERVLRRLGVRLGASR
jgi:hypothetical protein